MNKYLILIILFVSFAFKSKDPAIPYISNYKDIATREMQRTGIPASIKLAQALLESEYGKSPLAISANNHFGIKCGSRWTGKVYNKIDDDLDSLGNIIESCFRAYENAAESFIAHSDFLTDPKKKSRYGFLFEIPTSDYQQWAVGLKKAGYASDPLYPEKLIRIIEKYELHKLDNNSGNSNNEILNNEKAKSSEPIPSEEVVIITAGKSRLKSKNEILSKATKKTFITERKNGISAIKLLEPMSIEEIASNYGLKAYQLMAWNEIVESPTQIIEAENYIYLNEKKRDYGGKEEVHIVSNGETIESISSLYGIKANSLFSLNKIPKSCFPLENEKISLKQPNKNKVKYQRKIKNKTILF